MSLEELSNEGLFNSAHRSDPEGDAVADAALEAVLDAGDMMGFLQACRKADISAYGLLAELQAADSLLPEERANLASVAREMDCYRGKHGHLRQALLDSS